MGRKARLKRERRHDWKNAPVTIADAPAGLPKVSGALTELAQPFMDELGEDAQLEEVRIVFGLVSAAWNAGSLVATAPELADEVRAAVPPEARDLFEQVLEVRQRLHSDDLRVVTNVQVSQLIDGGFHVVAASMLTPAK